MQQPNSTTPFLTVWPSLWKWTKVSPSAFMNNSAPESRREWQWAPPEEHANGHQKRTTGARSRQGRWRWQGGGHGNRRFQRSESPQDLSGGGFSHPAGQSGGDHRRQRGQAHLPDVQVVGAAALQRVSLNADRGSYQSTGRFLARGQAGVGQLLRQPPEKRRVQAPEGGRYLHGRRHHAGGRISPRDADDRQRPESGRVVRGQAG